jgi:type I restriction enzyme S subunit
LSIAGKELCTNQGFKNIIPNTKIVNNEYLYYCLLLRVEELKNLGSGTTFMELSKSVIENFKIKLPDLQTQQKIAKVLSDLDAKIELNNRMNAELEAMAKLLYDYWFVQFDFPNEEGKPYKSSGGEMVFSEVLGRDVPKGWECGTLSNYIKNDKSGDWGKSEKTGNYITKVSCIRGADLNGLNGLNNKLAPPTRFILEKNNHKLLETHDLIVEISGGSPTQSTGRLSYITDETLERFESPLICSNFCKAITLKDRKLLYNFVYQWSRLYDYGVLFGWEGKTSGIKNLLFEKFVSNYHVVIPPLEIAEKFYDILKPIQAKKQKQLKQNQELTALRDWLLPMLMNGQVEVVD